MIAPSAYSRSHVAFVMELDADFADLVEAREDHRVQKARIMRDWDADAGGQK